MDSTLAIDYQQLQSDLLLWLRHRPEGVRFPSLRRVAGELWTAAGYDGTNQELKFSWDVLAPLLRTGVIRFIGDKKYSTTSACVHPTPTGCAVVNVRGGEDWLPGIQLLDKPAAIIAEELQAPLISFDLKRTLSHFPGWLRVISSKKSEFEPDTRTFSDLNWQWKIEGETRTFYMSKLPVTALLERGEPHGKQYAIKIGQQVYNLPSRDRNPMAYPLAYCADRLANRPEKIYRIDSDRYTLTINAQLFPAELEKLFFIHALQGKYPISIPPSYGARTYGFAPKLLGTVKRFFTPKPIL